MSSSRLPTFRSKQSMSQVKEMLSNLSPSRKGVTVRNDAPLQQHPLKTLPQ